MADPGGYEIRRLGVSAAEIPECGDLMRTTWPEGPYGADEYLDWQYRANPAGPALGFNAYAGNQLVAHYVTIPVRARLAGRDVTGLLSLNTATHPDHQGKKLFTRLADATFAAAADEGFAFVVGVANAQSTPGFVRKLGFQLVAPLEARIGVGRMRLGGGSGAGSEVGFERTWDHDMLAWRLANPSVGYRLRPAGDRVQVLAAAKYPGVAALLGEFDRATVSGIASRPIGVRPATVWIGLDPHRGRAKTAIYAEVPDRFRPSPLNLIFKPLGDEGLRVAPDDVRFGTVDFDPF